MNTQTKEFLAESIAHLFKNRHKYKNDNGDYKLHYAYTRRAIREDIEYIQESDHTPFNITRRIQSQAKIAKLQQEQFELQHLLKLSLGGMK